jgi:GNAT superfamily N-acetyltransferase
MPFESQAQRRFMYATDPKMAKRFEKKTKKKNLPEKVAVKKAPLDFESVRDVGVVEEGGFPYRRFEADFIDPETQERLPAFARLSDDGIGVGRIKDPNPEAYPSQRAFHMIHPYGDKGIYPYSIGTDSEFRGRGYQEALLHLIMRLAEAEGKTLYEPHQSMKTGDGTMFAQRMREKYGDEDVEIMTGDPEIMTGEPMDLAWRLLKRQTELGEFHEDFPSSLGPVTEYHGTMNLPAVSEQGIKARSSRKRSKKFVPEQLRGQDITYTTPDRERALAFAQERAQSLGLPSSQVGVVGVRAGGLPSPIQHQEPFGVLGGTMSNVRPSAIPRANIALLKRQTELGEFHPDLPSSHGPVKYYHGTPETNVQQIMRQGLRAGGPSYESMENYDPSFEGAYVTTEPERAYRYGERKGWAYRPIPAPALIGVREGAGMPEEYLGYGDGEDTRRLFPDDYRYMDDVDPKFLTQIKEAM